MKIYFTPTNRKKKSAFRRVVEWLHLWLGLISGLIVFIVCFTGGLWVWRYEIGYFTEKYQRVEVRNKPYLQPSALIAKTQAYLEVKKDTGAIFSNLINSGPGRSVMIGYTFGKKGIANIYVDPYEGHIILDKRKPSSFEVFILFVRAGHRFLWLPQKIGSHCWFGLFGVPGHHHHRPDLVVPAKLEPKEPR